MTSLQTGPLRFPRAGASLPVLAALLVGAFALSGCLRPQPQAAEAPSRSLGAHLFDRNRPVVLTRAAASATAAGPVYAPATPVPGDNGAIQPPRFEPVSAPNPSGAMVSPPPVWTGSSAPFNVPTVQSLPNIVAVPDTQPAAPPASEIAVSVPRLTAGVTGPPPSASQPTRRLLGDETSLGTVPAAVSAISRTAPATVEEPSPTVVPSATATAPVLPSVTASPSPSATPSPVPTPSATPVTCAGDEQMWFDPATPISGQAFAIVVRSTRAHVHVHLDGPGGPQFIGTGYDGGATTWRWQTTAGGPGQVTYTFFVGGAVCASNRVTLAPVPPTPTPTPSLLPDATRSSVSLSAGQVAPGMPVHAIVAVRNGQGQPLGDRLIGLSGARAGDAVTAPSRTGGDGLATFTVTPESVGTLTLSATDLATGTGLGQATLTVVRQDATATPPPTVTPEAAPTGTAVPTPSPAPIPPTATPRSPAPPGT